MKILITLFLATLFSCTSVQGLRNGYVSTQDGNKIVVADKSVYFHNNGVLIHNKTTVNGEGINVDKTNIKYADIQEIHLEK